MVISFPSLVAGCAKPDSTRQLSLLERTAINVVGLRRFWPEGVFFNQQSAQVLPGKTSVDVFRLQREQK